MGGSKNKSPAQKEKSQKSDDGKKSGSKKGKKSDKGEGGSKKAEITVIINEDEAMKIVKSSKVLTVQELSRQTGVKISAANAYLKKLLDSGQVKRIGGYSGHHLYQSVAA